MKRILVLLTAPYLALAGVAAAQTAGGGDVQTRQVPPTDPQTAAPHAYGRGHGFGGLPFGRLALGTTVTLNFYGGDPASGAESTQTLTFTYGEDSEAAFAEDFAAARADAAYMTAEVGEQTETLLSAAGTGGNARSDQDGLGRGFSRGFGHGALPLRGLTDGSSVTATFYDGDPEGGGQALQTLTFTYGESSAAGFAADYAAAAQEAAFVVVTPSPQTYTVPLTGTAFGFGDLGGQDQVGS